LRGDAHRFGGVLIVPLDVRRKSGADAVARFDRKVSGGYQWLGSKVRGHRIVSDYWGVVNVKR
jgi:hypothetical protein